MDQLFDIFVNWFPMLVFVGVMIWGMQRCMPQQKRTAEYYTAFEEGLRRQNEFLERIAIALEKNTAA